MSLGNRIFSGRGGGETDRSSYKISENGYCVLIDRIQLSLIAGPFRSYPDIKVTLSFITLLSPVCHIPLIPNTDNTRQIINQFNLGTQVQIILNAETTKVNKG